MTDQEGRTRGVVLESQKKPEYWTVGEVTWDEIKDSKALEIKREREKKRARERDRDRGGGIDRERKE